jgi:hypothetical protein
MEAISAQLPGAHVLRFNILDSMVFNFTLKPSPPSAKRDSTLGNKFIYKYIHLSNSKKSNLKLLADNKDSLIFFFIRFIS